MDDVIVSFIQALFQHPKGLQVAGVKRAAGKRDIVKVVAIWDHACFRLFIVVFCCNVYLPPLFMKPFQIRNVKAGDVKLHNGGNKEYFFHFAPPSVLEMASSNVRTTLWYSALGA